MQYNEFLNIIIESELVIVKGRWFSGWRDKNKLEGAIHALECCRGKSPKELKEVFRETVEYATMPIDQGERIWFEYYQEEIKFIMDIVSAVVVNEGWGKPLLRDQPTYRAIMKAAVVLNRE